MNETEQLKKATMEALAESMGDALKTVLDEAHECRTYWDKRALFAHAIFAGFAMITIVLIVLPYAPWWMTLLSALATIASGMVSAEIRTARMTYASRYYTVYDVLKILLTHQETADKINKS